MWKIINIHCNGLTVESIIFGERALAGASAEKESRCEVNGSDDVGQHGPEKKFGGIAELV